MFDNNKTVLHIWIIIQDHRHHLRFVLKGNFQQHLKEDFHGAVLQRAAAERFYSQQKESFDSVPTFTTSFYAKTLTILHEFYNFTI